MNIAEARALLGSSVLHAQGSYDDTDLDRAIIAACQRFVRETKCNRTRTAYSLASGTSSIDLTTGTGSITGWLAEWWVMGTINSYPVFLNSYDSVVRGYQGNTPTGRPQAIGFLTPSYGLFDKQTDAAYTLYITYSPPFTTWTAGTATTTTTIGVPDSYAREIIWWGARGYLLLGAPGHPDDQDALKQFDLVIERARGSINKTGAYYKDPDNFL